MELFETQCPTCGILEEPYDVKIRGDGKLHVSYECSGMKGCSHNWVHRWGLEDTETRRMGRKR